jgi:phosphatidylinositol glycan class K
MSDNWVVLVSTSRYWFNYRHLSNALSIYWIVKRLGIKDDHIIFMNAFDSVCSSKNPVSGEIYKNGIKYKQNESQSIINNEKDNYFNIYDQDIEIDYRNEDCNVDNFIRILIGRHIESTPISKRMNSNNESNILIYMSGHGGDEFLKFQDQEEISSQEMGYAINEMNWKNRYKEILLIVDTCQADTISNSITSPGVTVITSSKKNENSYAHDVSANIGNYLSYYLSNYLSNYPSYYQSIYVNRCIFNR